MMLEVRGLSAGYGAAGVLREIALDVAAGQIVALVGANGAGKSTLLKTISGLLPARSGTMTFEGERMETTSPAQRVRAGIAHVPEGRQVFGGLSVAENLRLGAYARRNATERELRSGIDDACAIFPMLAERLDVPAGGLSGGQQQMLAIARGLMAKPKLLLLDEPSLGLSPSLVADIFRTIVALRARDVGILIAEQNARMALAIADRGYVLENGRIASSGSGAELLQSPDVVERYLGVGPAEREATAPRETASMSERLRAILA